MVAKTRLTQTAWGGRRYTAGAFDGKTEDITRDIGNITRMMQMAIGGRRYATNAFASKTAEAADTVNIPNRYYRRSLKGVKLHYPIKWNIRL